MRLWIGAIALAGSIAAFGAGVARADVPGTPPPVNPCKEQGFVPACTGLPLDKGVCITIGANVGPIEKSTLTKEGFTKRCAGNFFYPEGPYRYQTCKSDPREEWCRDTRPDGITTSRALLCDLESAEGCSLDQRITSNNPKVVASVCIDRADSLKHNLYRHAWPKCRATWEAKGITLPAELTMSSNGSDASTWAPTSQGDVLDPSSQEKKKPSGRCNAAPDEGSSSAGAALFGLVIVGAAIRRRRTR